MHVTFFQEFSTSTEQASSNYYNSCGAISSLYVLGFRQFYKLKHINFVLVTMSNKQFYKWKLIPKIFILRVKWQVTKA